MRRAVIFAAAAAAAAVAAACGDSPVVNPDVDAAGNLGDAAAADAGSTADRIDPLLWVDFSATGCATGGFDDVPCTGPAPLEVRFTASAPAPIDTYLWAFGDGSPTDAASSPLHRFERPGTYDIGLTVGGPGGTADQMRTAWVVVEPAPLGAPCALDLQCDDTLECVCGAGSDCAAGIANGLCTRACDAATPCPATGTCADLGAGGGGGEEWMQSLCLPACEDDAQCSGGARCRELAGGGDDAWTRGCFPADLLADVGESCVDAGGVPDDTACASGLCVDEGARGMCSADCAADPCPSYAACATFTGGVERCVARCSAAIACDADPWLGCEDPGGGGTKAFTVDEAPAAAGYCAPKTCGAAEDCGPDGDCVAGFCAAAS
jgi:PKD repeat protein